MPRGGKRTPKKPAAVSGPGKLSRRTDGGPGDKKIQAPKTPGMASPDIQYGDVGQLEQAMSAAPIARSAPSAPRSPSPPRGSSGGPLPPGYITGRPTDRPGEPITEGMPFGPGGGPDVLQTRPEPEDDREVVLQWLVDQFGDADAWEMLQEMRTARQQPELGASLAPDGGISDVLGEGTGPGPLGPEGAATPAEPAPEDELEADSFVLGGGPPDDSGDGDLQLDPAEEA